MNNFYLTDIGVKKEDIVQNWCLNNNDDREEQWVKEREKYGFDERETWNLNTTFLQWLYPRLKMFNEANCIDTSYHKFMFQDKEITEQQCIDYMLERLEYVLAKGEFEDQDKYYQYIDEVLEIFKTCFHTLWW